MQQVVLKTNVQADLKVNKSIYSKAYIVILLTVSNNVGMKNVIKFLNQLNYRVKL